MMKKVCFPLGVIIFLMFAKVHGQQYSDETIPEEEINAIVNALLQPENFKYEMHRKSLVNALETLLAESYDQSLEEDDKRSIATLAKNGQLPSREPDTDMDTLNEDENGHKRNLASMARSGMIGGKRNIQSLARQMQYGSGKRNLGSLMRNNMFPGNGKRNIGSIMRTGYGKRNVGTLARDWALPKFVGSKYADDGKRNIQSMKNQIKLGRKKRDIGETLEPVFQTEPMNYEELLQSLNADYRESLQNPEEKRFLEFFSPQDRHRPAPVPGTSCKRCEFDQGLRRSQWGERENNLGLGNLDIVSSVQTRSGFRSTPPRVTALSWRDRW